MIRISNLYKRFGAQVVLDGVSLTVSSGEMIAVVGPSGTGKSVLLKIITGLLPADRGEVLVDDESMTAARSGRARRRICQRMGILFQKAALFDSLTLLENIAFPLRFHTKLSQREIWLQAREGLADVGLRGYENTLPGEVSIAMRKRVGLARALITKPDLVLFDEPNTGLDPETGQEIYDLINHTHKEFGYTGIIVSHEIPEVFQCCKRVAMLYQGKIQLEATIDDFIASKNPYVQQFIQGKVDGPIQAN